MKVKFMNFYKTETMKKTVITLLTGYLLSIGNMQAQNPNQERLHSYKIAFFTKRMNFTPGEAEKFWPLYNDFQNRKSLVQQERALLNRKFNFNAAEMNDRELTDAADKLIDLEMQEAALSKEFHTKLREILPPIKVIRVYQTENQYKIHLLNKLQDRPVQKNNINRR